MKIEERIKQHFEKRLEPTPVLVIYDPEKRYADIVHSMASASLIVIDGSRSTILGRERAMEAWRQLAANAGEKRLIVYLPMSKPRKDEERQRDPYQIFALGGGEFPSSDGESYQALCHQAAPELREQIDQLFEHGEPDFDTINNLIAGGSNWPRLKTLLQAESANEILMVILSPQDTQEKALAKDKTWLAEFKQFLQPTLDMHLKTKSRALTEIQNELWRFILFSEFVFDLPGELPQTLKDVPRAAAAFRALVYSICDQLRASERHQLKYMDMANQVASELQLEKHTASTEDFGKRDTFAFEERTFLKAFCNAAMAGQYDVTGRILDERKHSVWVRHTAERQQLWTVADRAWQLLKKSGDLEEQLKECNSKLSALFELYCNHFRVLDRLHRAFEQAVTDIYGELETLELLVESTRKRYLSLAEQLQAKFITAVKAEGWPVAGQIRNTNVFDKFVAPWLEERKKVAYFLVDALRYELAVELEGEISDRFYTNTTPVSAQLPTITPVGMAALMPGAEGHLRLIAENDALVPYISESKIKTPRDRFEYIKKLYGDRCHMVDLDDLVTKSKLKLPATTQLLIVKTTDIDDMGETSPLEARRMLPRLLKKLIAGVNHIQKKGFDRAVIATDHGFVLFDDQSAGDDVPKPPGDWMEIKDRCLLGRGSPAAGVLVFKREEVGIQGDFEDYAVPRTFGTFRKGNPYFHEGLSLQECVLPVVAIDFIAKTSEAGPSSIEIALSYKGGMTKQITTRRPMIEVVAFKSELFEDEVEFQLEAYAGEQLVGEVAASAYVNPATNLVRIKPGQALKIPLKMNDDFQGRFELRATNPNTGVNYATLKLETDYLD